MSANKLIPLMFETPPTTLVWSGGVAPSYYCSLSPLNNVRFEQMAFSAIGSASYFHGIRANRKIMVGSTQPAASIYQCPPAIIDSGNTYLQVLNGRDLANVRFLRSDGTMYVVGTDSWGSFGMGNTYPATANYDSLTAVAGVWSFLATGYRNNCAANISSTSKLFTCGYNDYGQLGHGDTTNRGTFAQVGSDDWAHVACGYNHMIGIKTDGTAWSWGNNAGGSLGQGDITNRSSPTQIGAATNWVRCFAGPNRSALMNSSGELYVFGFNEYGQLGLGDTSNRLSPTLLLASGVSDVLMSALGMLVLKTDKTVWASGYAQGTELMGGSPGSTLSLVYDAAPVLRMAVGYDASVLMVETN